MSDAEQAQADGAERLAFARLEAAVEQIVEERRLLAGELREARKRLGELEAALARAEKDGAEAEEHAAESARLRDRVTWLEEENGSLWQSVSEGLETVEGLLSRLDSG